MAQKNLEGVKQILTEVADNQVLANISRPVFAHFAASLSKMGNDFTLEIGKFAVDLI